MYRAPLYVEANYTITLKGCVNRQHFLAKMSATEKDFTCLGQLA
jgi:hypothetical protein